MITEQRRKELNSLRLEKVLPELRVKVLKVISDLEAEGLKPIVTCGFRSVAEQNELYALGRTRAGKIVTFAKGSQSLHTQRRAVDFAFLDKDGGIDWSDKLFKRLGVIANLHGLKWGGNWKKFKDKPHLEI